MDIDGYYHHKVPDFLLNRYGDRDIGYAHSSEIESGWDFTSRFYNRCDEFLPIDLNVYLFKYERDFAKIEAILGDSTEQAYWKETSEKRKEEINKHMWNEKKGFFFDYGYKHGRQSDFLSLAGFTPLWAAFATHEQAKKMVKKLPLFETENGLVITAEESLAPQLSLKGIPDRFKPAIESVLKPKQWDWPNIWPPLEYLTVIGLLKYGFEKDAVRIMNNSLNAQSKIFKRYGTFFEKFNGVTGDKTDNFHYETQSGFGWTNAIFYRYVQILDAIEKGINIYADPEPNTDALRLSIPH
jgi:alpha,alpha-trehalase